MGRVKVDSAGIDTVTNTEHGPNFFNSRGVHIGSVAELGKIGFGVSGCFGGGHTIVGGIDRTQAGVKDAA